MTSLKRQLEGEINEDMPLLEGNKKRKESDSPTKEYASDDDALDQAIASGDENRWVSSAASTPVTKTVTFSDTLEYEERPFFLPNVTKEQRVAAYRDFFKSLGYERIWYRDLQNPKDLLKTFQKGKKNSDYINPHPLLEGYQKLPSLLPKSDHGLLVMVGPMKLTKSWNAPLGNYQRQRQVGKNPTGDQTNYNPQTEDEVKNILYSFSYDCSAAFASFNVHDELATDSMLFLAQIEDKAREIAKEEGKIDLGKRFSFDTKYLEPKFSPYVTAKTEKELDSLLEPNFKPLHEMLKNHCLVKHQFNVAPKMLRLNPARATDPSAPALLDIPFAEQHAWEEKGDIHFVCMKIGRLCGQHRQLIADGHHILTIGKGFNVETLPGPEWFAQAEDRKPTLTLTQLYESEPRPNEVFQSSTSSQDFVKLEQDYNRKLKERTRGQR